MVQGSTCSAAPAHQTHLSRMGCKGTKTYAPPTRKNSTVAHEAPAEVQARADMSSSCSKLEAYKKIPRVVVGRDASGDEWFEVFITNIYGIRFTYS